MLIIFHYKSIYDFPHFADGRINYRKREVLNNSKQRTCKVILTFAHSKVLSFISFSAVEPLLKTWSCINLPGRFQHVHLGDTFSMCPASDRPRYKVFQKLGQGAFSTVWIAQDMADHEYYVMFPKHLCRAEYKHLAAASKSPRRISWNMRPTFSQTLSSPADNSYRGLPSWFLASWTSKGLPMRHCSPWPTYPSGDPLRRWVLW